MLKKYWSKEFSRKAFCYLVSGGSAFSFNLLGLYFLADILKIWYLTSSVIAFISSFLLGFTLNKFWTFRNKDLSVVYAQMSAYFLVILINLVANTILMFSLVEFGRINHLAAQVFSSLLIAFYSFFAYQSFVFKKGDQGSLPNEAIF